jgi:hypothetical protein
MQHTPGLMEIKLSFVGPLGDWETNGPCSQEALSFKVGLGTGRTRSAPRITCIQWGAGRAGLEWEGGKVPSSRARTGAE